MSKIYGDTVGGGGFNSKKIPQPDWNQTDETQADYIKNKPTLGALSGKDEVAQIDLTEDVQLLLEKADNSLSQDELQNGINLALAQAKESGEFDGAAGKSAYEIAVAEGYEDTEQEWVNSLRGVGIAGIYSVEEVIVPGMPGEPSPPKMRVELTDGRSMDFELIDGKDGENGIDGKDGVGISNIEIAEDGHLVIYFTNDTVYFSPISIIGDKGDSFKYEDFTPEQLEVLKGENGKTAYQTAVDKGYEGTEEEWLASLEGADGYSIYYSTEEATSAVGTTTQSFNISSITVVDGRKLQAGDLIISANGKLCRIHCIMTTTVETTVLTELGGSSSGGSLNITDDGAGNVVIEITNSNISTTDDGNGNVVI